jgi:hypothetical protein
MRNQVRCTGRVRVKKSYINNEVSLENRPSSRLVDTMTQYVDCIFIIITIKIFRVFLAGGRLNSSEFLK